jgi:hypothetical protein
MQVGSEMRKVVFFEVAVNHVVRTKQEIDSEPVEKTVTYWHSVNVFRPGLQSYVLNNVVKG